MLFLFSKTGSGTVLEEKYSKQIALALDSAKPGMVIHLNMKDAIDVAKKELGEDAIGDLVSINENIVTVRLQEGSGYSYSFFNGVDATVYLDRANNEQYVFVVDEITWKTKEEIR